MKIHSLDIPENSADVPGWLEDFIVGPNLAELVAELSALHADSRAEPRSLDSALGDDLPRATEQGLAALSRQSLRTLLREPQLLIELQERIFVDGGAYWDRRAAPEIDDLAGRTWNRLDNWIAGVAEQPAPTGTADVLPMKPRPWYAHPAVVSLATAAALLAGVFSWDAFGPRGPVPAATAWGWERPGAFASKDSAQQYLNALANAGIEWFKKRPESPDALAMRIGEFRRGCTVLILAEHKPLSNDDRAWLVERCRAWAGKLDKHLADVEAGRDPLAVRAEVDETVNALVKALQTRAETAA
jgi:hypothetical protein